MPYKKPLTRKGFLRNLYNVNTLPYVEECVHIQTARFGKLVVVI